MAVDVVAGDEDWFVEEAKKAKSRSRTSSTPMCMPITSRAAAARPDGGRRLLPARARRGVVKFPFEPLRDNHASRLGNVHRPRTAHAWPHARERLSLLVIDKRRGEEPWFVLTGDTLFVGAVGRPDLLGREREMAGMLFDTLQTKLLSLARHPRNFSASPSRQRLRCRASGKPSSTLGFERRWNPALFIRNRDEFIAYLTRDIPPRPAEYGSNRGGEPRRVTSRSGMQLAPARTPARHPA